MENRNRKPRCTGYLVRPPPRSCSARSSSMFSRISGGKFGPPIPPKEARRGSRRPAQPRPQPLGRPRRSKALSTRRARRHQEQSDAAAAARRRVAKGTLKNPYTDNPEAIAQGKKLYFGKSCNGCHGGGGGGGMCPPLTNTVWVYGDTDDTLFRLISIGSDELKKQGYSRKGPRASSVPCRPSAS